MLVLDKDWWKKEREPATTGRLRIVRPMTKKFFSDGTLYTTEEAAKLLKKSVYNVCEMCKAGEVEAVKDKKRWLIFGHSLNSYLQRMMLE